MAVKMTSQKSHGYLQSRRPYRTDPKFPLGAAFMITGDSKDMWLDDYNVRVNTIATVTQQPETRAKKVLVTLAEIDGDQNVCVLIRKNALKRRV